MVKLGPSKNISKRNMPQQHCENVIFADNIVFTAGNSYKFQVL